MNSITSMRVFSRHRTSNTRTCLNDLESTILATAADPTIPAIRVNKLLMATRLTVTSSIGSIKEVTDDLTPTREAFTPNNQCTDDKRIFTNADSMIATILLTARDLP